MLFLKSLPLNTQSKDLSSWLTVICNKNTLPKISKSFQYASKQTINQQNSYLRALGVH